jgi:hypothetical protein
MPGQKQIGCSERDHIHDIKVDVTVTITSAGPWSDEKERNISENDWMSAKVKRRR